MLAWPGSPVIYVIPGIWSLFFYVLQLAILLLMVKCAAQLGIMQFLGITCSDDVHSRELVTEGCYAIVRHPQYVLGMAFMVLNPVMTFKWLTLTALSGLYFWWGSYIEEKRISRISGAAYQKYRQLVPMFIPRFSRKKRPSLS
jgi:protein-S-isoprenylcysteine O-methyltransferase Ste14